MSSDCNGKTEEKTRKCINKVFRSILIQITVLGKFDKNSAIRKNFFNQDSGLQADKKKYELTYFQSEKVLRIKKA